MTVQKRNQILYSKVCVPTSCALLTPIVLEASTISANSHKVETKFCFVPSLVRENNQENQQGTHPLTPGFQVDEGTEGGEADLRLRSCDAVLSKRREHSDARWEPAQVLQQWANGHEANCAEQRSLFQDRQMTWEETAPDGSGSSLKEPTDPECTESPAA